MDGKSRQDVVELVLAGNFLNKYILHPVVENLLRIPAEVFKRSNMTIQKGRQVTAFYNQPAPETQDLFQNAYKQFAASRP